MFPLFTLRLVKTMDNLFRKLLCISVSYLPCMVDSAWGEEEAG